MNPDHPEIKRVGNWFSSPDDEGLDGFEVWHKHGSHSILVQPDEREDLIDLLNLNVNAEEHFAVLEKRSMAWRGVKDKLPMLYRLMSEQRDDFSPREREALHCLRAWLMAMMVTKAK